MTRNLIATASRALGMVRSTSRRPARHRAAFRLESLEYRLSLSSVSTGGVAPADLNPQPLPPGFMAPMIVGAHIGTSVELRKH
jgi:hypothetical protein